MSIPMKTTPAIKPEPPEKIPHGPAVAPHTRPQPQQKAPRDSGDWKPRLALNEDAAPPEGDVEIPKPKKRQATKETNGALKNDAVRPGVGAGDAPVTDPTQEAEDE